MSCRILRRFVTQLNKDPYRIEVDNTITIYKGMEWFGVKLDTNDHFSIYTLFSTDSNNPGFVKSRYFNIKIKIEDILSLMDEELVLIYGKSILDKELIIRLNLVSGMNISISDFSKFLEV